MTKAVEFLFDFGSPTSYLAYKQLPKIASRHGARIVWTPILLGGVGFFLYGPDALLSGAGAMDIGSRRAAVFATGVIAGFGAHARSQRIPTSDANRVRAVAPRSCWHCSAIRSAAIGSAAEAPQQLDVGAAERFDLRNQRRQRLQGLRLLEFKERILRHPWCWQ